MRSGAGAATCVPALRTTIPGAGSCLGPCRGQGRGAHGSSHGWDRGSGKPSQTCPRHQAHGAVAELEKAYAQVVVIIHLNTYSSSCVRSAGAAAAADPRFLFPPSSLSPSPGMEPPPRHPFSPPRDSHSPCPLLSWWALHAG